MLDQTNATLLSVAGSSSGESFDGPEADGPVLWEDPAAVPNAYLRVRRDRVQAGAVTDRVVDRRLVVETDTPPVEWKSGLWIVFEHAGVEERARVKLVETYNIDDPDIPAEVQTTRLTLEAA